MTRYLGIDCGFSGALAVIETINGVPVLVDAIDMPHRHGCQSACRRHRGRGVDCESTRPRRPLSSARKPFQGRAHQVDSSTAVRLALSKPWSRCARSRWF